MRKTIMMAMLVAIMLTGNSMKAQTIHRADRRPVVAMNNGYSPREIRQINLMKQQIQREIMRARADGVVTFRERKAIERRRNALNRYMTINRNDLLVRR